MTLNQYLGAVAWLFIAFLMWFSVTRAQYVYDSYDARLYLLFKRFSNYWKLESSNFSLIVFIFGPALFYTACGAILFLPVLLT